MAPNKKWMSSFSDQLNKQYQDGIKAFLNYALLRTF
ncbi:unnamed protein product [Cuscuta europaea]|uniref:Uncharacterized protein n=1 Tax=Cuscuta europaea TaxID=41803 RepID=A0A9P1A142_CUSEU|nr:unnamed protein product [Cuscuta europaea]